MSPTKKSHVTVKLFVGCPISSEIKMLLKQSQARKQSLFEQQALAETSFQNKEYIGRFLDQSAINLKELRLIGEEIKQMLHTYCPDMSVDQFSLVFFPQIFIA